MVANGHHSRNRSRDRGASLVEYALLVALIALVCIGSLAFLGTANSASLDNSANSLISAGN